MWRQNEGKKIETKMSSIWNLELGQNQSQGTKEMWCLSSTKNCYNTSLMAQRNQIKHLLLLQHSVTSCSLFSPSVLSFCNTSFLSSFYLKTHFKMPKNIHWPTAQPFFPSCQWAVDPHLLQCLILITYFYQGPRRIASDYNTALMEIAPKRLFPICCIVKATIK